VSLDVNREVSPTICDIWARGLWLKTWVAMISSPLGSFRHAEHVPVVPIRRKWVLLWEFFILPNFERKSANTSWAGLGEREVLEVADGEGPVRNPLMHHWAEFQPRLRIKVQRTKWKTENMSFTPLKMRFWLVLRGATCYIGWGWKFRVVVPNYRAENEFGSVPEAWPRLGVENLSFG